MDTEIDLKSITGLLQRQLKLILVTAALTLTISLCIIYGLTPRYSATALLMVDTASKDLLARDRGYSNSGADNARVESEVGILRWLHRHRDRVVSRAELLEHVFGQRGDLQTRAVDMAISVLRRKLEADPDAPTVIVSVKGAGYAWGPDPSDVEGPVR